MSSTYQFKHVEVSSGFVPDFEDLGIEGWELVRFVPFTDYVAIAVLRREVADTPQQLSCLVCGEDILDAAHASGLVHPGLSVVTSDNSGKS